MVANALKKSLSFVSRCTGLSMWIATFRLPAAGLHQAQITSEATTARDRRFYIITTIFSVQHIYNYEQKTCNKGLTCPQSKRYPTDT